MESARGMVATSASKAAPAVEATAPMTTAAAVSSAMIRPGDGSQTE